MTRALLAALTFACLAQPVLSQELEAGEFERRRRELRRRYQAAENSEERRAVLDEFRQLDLRKKSTDGALPDDYEPLSDTEAALLIGLGDTMAAIGRAGEHLAAPAGNYGLGPDASLGPETQHLMDLIAWTEMELSDEGTPRWGTLLGSHYDAGDGTDLKDASHDIIEEWRPLRFQVLPDFLTAGKAELAHRKNGGEPGEFMGDFSIGEWERALGDAGVRRRFIAEWIVQHHKQESAKLARMIAGDKAQMARHVAAYEAIQDAMKDAARAKSLVKTVLDIYEAAKTLQSVAGMMAEPDTIGVEMLDHLAGKADKSEDVILMGVDLIGDYTVMLEIAAQGYAGLGDLLSQMKSTGKSIQHLSYELARSRRYMAKAQALADRRYYDEKG